MYGSRKLVLAAGLFCGIAGLACAQSMDERPQSRGALLYSTHCIACHSTEVHWREKKLATDLNSLTREVRRWQDNARLGWSEEDVTEVSRHLNALYYRFP